jgi:PPOX class probable F420-dependent enzyme
VIFLATVLNDHARQLVEGKNFAFLATIMPDGSPQVTPVWIDHEGNTLLVNTSMGRTKQKNLARDTRVALSVANQKDMYDKILVRGRVIMQTPEGADVHIDKLAKKYLGMDKYPWLGPGEKRVILKIEPIHIST